MTPFSYKVSTQNYFFYICDKVPSLEKITKTVDTLTSFGRHNDADQQIGIVFSSHISFIQCILNAHSPLS